jgi:hypothetical protein
MKERTFLSNGSPLPSHGFSGRIASARVIFLRQLDQLEPVKRARAPAHGSAAKMMKNEPNFFLSTPKSKV